ncbi:MAG: DEAD/DEAH box helicase family protein [Lachnospiraceae bacterium]|nr:DEAD/DEAH box helicase family protein [Lachnospiraceae bacterium]
MALYENDIVRLQKYLPQLRKCAGLSAEELGKKLGVTKQAISALEAYKDKMISKVHYIALRSVIDDELLKQKQNINLRDCYDLVFSDPDFYKKYEEKIEYTIGLIIEDIKKQKTKGTLKESASCFVRTTEETIKMGGTAHFVFPEYFSSINNYPEKEQEEQRVNDSVLLFSGIPRASESAKEKKWLSEMLNSASKDVMPPKKKQVQDKTPGLQKTGQAQLDSNTEDLHHKKTTRNHYNRKKALSEPPATSNVINEHDEYEPSHTVVKHQDAETIDASNNERESEENDDNSIIYSVTEGLEKCLNDKGKVDIEYISLITGRDKDNVIDILKGRIYQNPDTWNQNKYEGWEIKEVYLSGDLYNKKMAAEGGGEQFKDNLEEINKAMQYDFNDENISLGNPWVSPEIIQAFIKYYINGINLQNDDIKKDEITNTWRIEWGHIWKRKGQKFNKHKDIFLKLLADALNNRNSNEQNSRIPDPDRYLEERNALDQIFRCWIKQEKEKGSESDKYIEQYMRFFLLFRKGSYDGSILQHESKIELRDYQKNAVSRILFTKNVLLAHDVGSGKTLIMIAAAMKLKKIDPCCKSMFVVPNNITGQWERMFLQMYPKAKVIVLDSKSFSKTKRKKVLDEIKTNDFDGIIISHSCFEMISVSKKYKIQLLKDELIIPYSIYSNYRKLNEKNPNLKRLIISILKEFEDLHYDWTTLVERYDAMIFAKSGRIGQNFDHNALEEMEELCFEQLGITRLFVDEAHNYRNLEINTRYKNEIGIRTKGARKCKDMYQKVRYIQSINNGGGVVFATATPITNSITDLYIMQYYLQKKLLEERHLWSFDAWAAAFAKEKFEWEVDVDGRGYRQTTRYSEFQNIKLLSSFATQFIDFHNTENEVELPKYKGYQDIQVNKTEALRDYFDEISARVDRIRDHLPSSNDNMLKVTTNGRQAALDLRLVNEESPFSMESKVYYCTEKVYEIYSNTESDRSTQLIFCDLGVPKEGFNIYDELKRLLIDKGVDENDIAFIHDAEKEDEKEKLYDSVNSGEIRILIGSTPKLGMGVNVQSKLIALHHFDVPWRPSDMTQREGRILRQGNANEEVEIYRYITEGSFDAFLWQLLEIKQGYISQFLSGTIREDENVEIDKVILTYGEAKALATGNPKMKDKAELLQKLRTYRYLQQRHENKISEYQSKLFSNELKLKKLRENIPKYELDYKLYKKQQQNEKQNEKNIIESIFEILEEERTGEQISVFDYQGFQIILPEDASQNNPYIYFRGAYQYTIPLTRTVTGTINKIDRLLNGLEKRISDSKEECQKLESYQKDIENDLLREIELEYTKEVIKLEEQINELDREIEAESK